MKWYKKPDTQDYECIFFEKNGTEVRYELPFRKLEIEVIEIAAKENLNVVDSLLQVLNFGIAHT